MKSLYNFLNEKLNIDNTVIRENDVFYHVTKENNLKLKDYPMFAFADKKESDALVNNFKEEGYDSNQYVLTLKPYTLIIDGDEVAERIDDWYDSVEPNLLSNPGKKELEKYIKLIENAFKDKKVDGVYLMDYSQIDYNDDAESILIFHPNKSVKSFKLVDDTFIETNKAQQRKSTRPNRQTKTINNANDSEIVKKLESILKCKLTFETEGFIVKAQMDCNDYIINKANSTDVKVSILADNSMCFSWNYRTINFDEKTIGDSYSFHTIDQILKDKKTFINTIDYMCRENDVPSGWQINEY